MQSERIAVPGPRIEEKLNMPAQRHGLMCMAHAIPPIACLATLGLALFCGRPPAFAQEPNAGVTVTGWGQAMARPQSLELHVKVTGNGQLGVDALARFEQYRKELAEIVAAFASQRAKMHAGGIVVTPGGDPNAYWQTLTPGGQPAVGELAVSSICRITIAGLEDLSEKQIVELVSNLVDKLRDSGLTLLPAQNAQALEAGVANDVYAAPALVGFVLEDVSEAQAAARESAFRNARASAEALSKLAGMRLGPVVAMQEISSGFDPAAYPAQMEFDWDDELDVDVPAVADGGSELRLVSRTSGPVPIRVGLQVRFALLSPDNDAPQAGQGAGEVRPRAQAAAAGAAADQPRVSTGSEMP